MAGILDNKRRVLDTIVTQAGKQQIARGKLQIKYVAFTDADTFYESDIISGSTDATRRISFEACNLPQDNVTFEADDSGALKPFKNDKDYDIISGQLVSWSHEPVYSSNITSSVVDVYATGAEFASLSDQMLGSSIDNFKKLSIIGSYDSIFDDRDFMLSRDSATFKMTLQGPIDYNVASPDLNVNNIDSLFTDPRLSHIPNFKKLPPNNFKANRSQSSQATVLSARVRTSNYAGLVTSDVRHDENSPVVQQLVNDLDSYLSVGHGEVFDFVSTSHSNNVVCQMFEQSGDKLLKLDVIDYGTVSTSDQKHPTSHIFFVGKVFLDDNDCHTFVHMFTIKFD